MLEDIGQLLEIAHFHTSYWSGEGWGKLLDPAIRQVEKDYQDNNMEDLYYISKPKLESIVVDSLKAMSDLEYNPQ
jgi:hypothetical protein